ncbi:MAG: amidohydrolase family protein [Armatimonadota bacterium]
MMVDFHAHIWHNDDDGDRCADAARVHGVDRVCISGIKSHVPDLDEVKRLNDLVHEAVRGHPDRLIGFAYVNPRHGAEALAEMERCFGELGMRGLKLWVSCYADDPGVDPIVERAGELGVPVLQHAWRKWTGNLPTESDPVHVARMADKHPDVPIVMAHAGGDWEYGVKAIRDAPNVCVDTSGSIAHDGFIEFCVAELGAERVIWGTDMPGADLLYALHKVTGAQISEEAKSLILGGNARRLLRLD